MNSLTAATDRIPRVLIVDDDEIIHLSIRHFGSKFALPVQFNHAYDVGEAVDQLNGSCFDAAVIDVCLPGVTGVSFGALIREYDVNIPLAYLTNLDTEAVRAEAVSQRAIFLSKGRFVGDDQGMHELLTIIKEMVFLNPCLKNGARIDNHGFPRKLAVTPIELPKVLSDLLAYSRITKARAAIA